MTRSNDRPEGSAAGPARRTVLAGLAALPLAPAPGWAATPAAPRVVVSTALGDFTVEVYPDRAPLSAADFLAYVDRGLLDNQSVYRIVSMANQPDTVPAKIEVIQFGWRAPDGNDDAPPPVPPIAHEPTSVTGLRHRDGTLSMARLAPGTASNAFFICIGDQPELDFGGRRNPDGQGFAAFGQVVDGMDVVRKIFARAEADDRLASPIPILKARRLP
ncbi:peptidylprolyl isomerase [Inquilinus limosus]|uniref:peptidylprolyl isomerase n=1 Tax=Inquilinus limosus TaxID=171674 RepID=A0A211ZEI1_9PROT|nr:peptidylprolyl isomerase [Inquilinus limosus]OWJ63661.1 hypothetical protein BWR60_28925 [Inquilinus limosus]